MWEAFRVLDEQIQMLTMLRDGLVDREADACKLADLIDLRVIRLTKKYKRLLQDEAEAEEWVADVESLGIDTPRERKRESNAREALETIERRFISCLPELALSTRSGGSGDIESISSRMVSTGSRRASISSRWTWSASFQRGPTRRGGRTRQG